MSRHRITSHADTGAHDKVVLFDIVGRRYGLQYRVGETGNRLLVTAPGKHDKLVSTLTAHQVGFTGNRQQAPGHLLEQVVTVRMAMAVVDVLEIIEIDEKN